ncbi:hypothetical protein [Pseudomonas putida]|uniref:hypothetical protein n=1 Tax=Pseudomonas putida TaxID=303 RepID=UPI00300E79FF
MAISRTALIISASRGLGLGLVQRLQGQVFDLVFVNAGVMGPLPQDLEAVHNNDIGELFMTNAVAPIRVARRLIGQVREDSGVLTSTRGMLEQIKAQSGNGGLRFINYKGDPLVW